MIILHPWNKWWWRYVFATPWTWRKIWCRIRNHPYGVVWYNPYGWEPDMHCKNCDDDLG